MCIEQGQLIKLIRTDPWDFVTAIGSGPFNGVITDVQSPGCDKVIVHLNHSLHYKNVEFCFVVASARHVGDKFEGSSTGSLFCNIVSLTEEEGRAGTFSPVLPLNGRLSFLGDITYHARHLRTTADPD